MHVPSVSDYKTNRGGEKKKREGKNCIVWKTAPYPIPSPYECKNRISPTSLFLNPNLLFRHHVQGETVLNESSTTNDLVQLGFNLNSSRQRAIRGEVVQRRRKKPDVARFPRVTESTTAPTRGGGRSIYLAVRVLDVYTRGLQLSLLTLMGRQGTAMGVGESTGWSSGVPGLY